MELSPGVSLYLQGVKVTKTKKVSGFDIACKWQRKYRGWAPDEGWFILTNLDTLPDAINAYKKRFDIEEMFKDCKTGGYNLEETGVQKQRLISLILMIAIAYSSAIIQGGEMKQMGMQKYICRVKEPGRNERRRSTFGVGLDGQLWVTLMDECGHIVADLMRLNPNKLTYYQRGLRAVQLIQSTL